MAKQNSKKLRALVLASLFVALDFVFTRVFCVYLMGGAERVSLQFLATAVCGWIMGPWWGAAVAAVGDLIGGLLAVSGFSFFPGFTLTAALRGFFYGLILHGKKVTFPRTLLAEGMVSILLRLFLNAYWLTFYLGKNFTAYLAAKTPLRLILLPVQAIIIFLVLRALEHHGMDRKAMALPLKEPEVSPAPAEKQE